MRLPELKLKTRLPFLASLLVMDKNTQIEVVRNGLRLFNRKAGVLKSDPYGIGLPLSHCSALIDINRKNSLKPSELTSLLLLDKSTISRILINLESKDLIKILTDDKDGRSKVLSLTSKGRKLVDIIDDVSNETVRDVFQKLNLQERQAVAHAFNLILQTFESNET
jgi:DNA-binding MarR family transcriptional regulator